MIKIHAMRCGTVGTDETIPDRSRSEKTYVVEAEHCKQGKAVCRGSGYGAAVKRGLTGLGLRRVV